jgi:hypothetical protein
MKRDVRRIKTFDDFKAFMRYNQWTRDPYSQGDPAQQIASRYDQRPPVTPYGARNSFGDMDTKALRLTEALTKMRFSAIASPPYDNDTTLKLPPWNFDTYNKSITLQHDGLPPEWTFNWTDFGAEGFDVCGGYTEKNRCLDAKEWCGWCSYLQACLVGDKNGAFFEKCQAGWEVHHDYQSWARPLIAVVTVITMLFVALIYVMHFRMKASRSRFD